MNCFLTQSVVTKQPLGDRYFQHHVILELFPLGNLAFNKYGMQDSVKAMECVRSIGRSSVNYNYVDYRYQANTGIDNNPVVINLLEKGAMFPSLLYCCLVCG